MSAPSSVRGLFVESARVVQRAREEEELVIHIGIDVARMRNGATAVLRTLYRSRLDPVLPVL